MGTVHRPNRERTRYHVSGCRRGAVHRRVSVRPRTRLTRHASRPPPEASRPDGTPERDAARRTMCPPGRVIVARLTVGQSASRPYEQVGAAVGFVSQYTRVPKLSGPCRAIAAARLSLFADVSVVE